MFKQLESFLENADLSIVISKNGDVTTVSVLPKMKDEKAEKLAPLVMRGTLDQLDGGFIANLAIKLPVLTELIVETKAFDESVAEAKVDLEADKKKAEKTAADKSKTKSKGKTSAPAAKKAEPKVKEKSDADKAKDALKAGDTAMEKKDYNEAVNQYQIASDILKTNKGVNDKLEAAKRWKKHVDAMYADDKKSDKEVIAESNPAQASLLDHPNVLIVKPNVNTPASEISVGEVTPGTMIEEEEPTFEDAEGHGESDDNAPEQKSEEEEINFG